MEIEKLMAIISENFVIEIKNDYLGHFAFNVFSKDNRAWILTNYGISFDRLVNQTYKDLSNKCLI